MANRAGAVLPGIAGALTVGAGLVHATAAGNHAPDTAVVVLFAVTAAVQVFVGMAAGVRPNRPVLATVAVVDLVVAAAWLASRTTGLPLVEGLAEPAAIGLQDLVATLMETVGGAAALLALAPAARAAGAALSPFWALALAPALIGMTASHTHGGGDHGTRAQGEHHAHGHENVTVDLAADPIFAGAETGHSSEAELRAAKDLVERTRASVGARFHSEVDVVAAGYRSIGDGFPITPFEHFIHPGYMTDGRELDPTRVESIVLTSSATEGQVVSAMYILEPGKTMADVPALGGQLTAWHDHQNLCWDESGTRLRGFLVRGKCVPSGSLRPTPPMLHVWLQQHECGPFAGLEGHGTDCAAHHH